MTKKQMINMCYSTEEEKKQCESIIEWLKDKRSGFEIITVDTHKTLLINTETNEDVYEISVEVASEVWN